MKNSGISRRNFLGKAATVGVAGVIVPSIITSCAREIKKQKGQDVPLDKCFVGFDAYQKVLDAGVDLVILATPPFFRPDHLAAAIQAKKHVFAEKPVCVDPVGARSVMATAQK